MSANSAIFNPTESTSAATGDGFSVPRLTTTGRLAIVFGAGDKGMMVYDTTLNNLFIWNGSAWESVPASGDAGANGAVQYNDNGVVSGATGFFWDKTNGYVGVNTATPTERITINNSPGPVTGAIRVYANDQSIARIAVQNTNGQAYHLVAGYPGANNQGFAIYDYTNSAMRMYLDTSGNLLVPNGNFVVGTSGKGIDFSATASGSGTMTSELLSDYEEGTFTATLRGFNVEPATKLTATCIYTKVGRLVNVVGEISGDTTGYVGVAYITGLPFVTAAACSGAANANFIDLKTRTSLASLAVNADTAVYFLAVGSTVGTVYAEHDAGAGRSFSFNITYTV